ncbi:peroxin-6, partial [Tremellales sp. Uapishka_1]
MPVPHKTHKPILAQALSLDAFSSSSQTAVSTEAEASSELWEELCRRGRNASPKLGIAVEWPEDGRLPEIKSRKSLVIWVKRSESSSADKRGSLLFLPSHLFPPYTSGPLNVRIHLHEPIPLTLAILQQVESDVHEPEFDVSSTEILREGETISPSSSSTYRILLLEPVQQGFLTSTTKVILSTTPFIPSLAETDPSDEVSHASRLSLEDFDPDAFLSSSLSMSYANLDGDDGFADDLYSSTSGSLTPRPMDRRPFSPPVPVQDVLGDEEERGGTRFTAVRVYGKGDKEDICWVGVGGLGRAGIFDGDWVLIKSADEKDGSSGRLIRVQAWERLDEFLDEVGENPILLPPSIHRFLSLSTSPGVRLFPTTFGARQPTLPTAKSVTISRIATAEGVDKRYERSWLAGLKRHFSRKSHKGKEKEQEECQIVRRGDIFSVPVWSGKPVQEGEEEEEPEDDQFHPTLSPLPTALVYFVVSALSYEPLVPVEQDFRSSVSSKARAGELGCWVDVDGEETTVVLSAVERVKVGSRDGDRSWHGIQRIPKPFSAGSSSKLSDILRSSLVPSAVSWMSQVSILAKGARGAGKSSMIRSIAEELGFNVVLVECYDIVGDSATVTEGSIQAQLEKAKSCAPAVVLMNHIEALSRSSESAASGRIKVLEDAMKYLRKASLEAGWPVVVVGTTADADAVPAEILGCFKQDITISAPTEAERLAIARNVFDGAILASDVDLKKVATQTAALQAGDIVSLAYKAQDLALRRGQSTSMATTQELRLAGLTVTAADISAALGDARSSYSDSIGAPKIPNVSWDDVGGLASVKSDILDTIQLPLEHPELFAEGLKKRSGILLYGPPGTGKTLLAKAVATSCSLNFFSVKGPELLNMYIGESEANVRRVFQRARDAQPCVIFMDELDSVAPKRGNQGDSGGVMDRIVSQLLAELDGMSDGRGGQGVYVMAATNRPDLLDPALLRPGRFDRMLYLGVPDSHQAQYNILQALTRKFQLDDRLDLMDIAEACPFNYTGADLYALSSDAMLRAMTRKAEGVDAKIGEFATAVTSSADEPVAALLNTSPAPHDFPYPLTPQYYLSTMAEPEDIEVRVSKEDFMVALEKLVPSVSRSEMDHYERVQREFKGFEIGNGNQVANGHA